MTTPDSMQIIHETRMETELNPKGGRGDELNTGERSSRRSVRDLLKASKTKRMELEQLRTGTMKKRGGNGLWPR